jgi:hypothetical protein
MPDMDETATCVLDDNEVSPGPVDSPSQISQGTTSIAAEGEETLPQVPRPQTVDGDPQLGGGSWDRVSVTRLVVAAAVVVAVFGGIVGLAIWVFGWLK